MSIWYFFFFLENFKYIPNLSLFSKKDTLQKKKKNQKRIWKSAYFKTVSKFSRFFSMRLGFLLDTVNMTGREFSPAAGVNYRKVPNWNKCEKHGQCFEISRFSCPFLKNRKTSGIYLDLSRLHVHESKWLKSLMIDCMYKKWNDWSLTPFIMLSLSHKRMYVHELKWLKFDAIFNDELNILFLQIPI